MTIPQKPDKNDLLAAFDSVVDREREKAITSASVAKAKGTSRVVIALCIVSWGWLGYAWIGRPAWLFPRDPALLRTPAEREATLRFGMYLERERVRDYLERNRRLPAELKDAGDTEDGVVYVVTGGDSFTLMGIVGDTTLHLSSADSAEEFLKQAGIKPTPRTQ